MLPGIPARAPEVLSAFPQMAGVRAFFTTRAGGVSAGSYASLNLGAHCGDDAGAVRENWGILLESQGLSGGNPVLPRLCHGAAMAEAGPGMQAAEAEADAVFTRARGLVVAVTMADCLAVLVADPESGCVAAVHAGWRGSRDNVLGRALARLFANGCCRPETTRVALGPCLFPAALEIGQDVAASLPREHLAGIGGRAHFDLRGCNRAQAIAAGLPAENVTGIGGCTRDNPELFFSHRRARAAGAANTGRMAACIALV